MVSQNSSLSSQSVRSYGFATIPHVLSEIEIDSLGNELSAAALPPLPKPTLSTEQQEKADDFERKSTEHMGKYDKPVAPRRGPAVPGFAWPQWLVHIEGQPLRIQKTSNMFTSSYTTNMDGDSIRSYYADLLSYNGYSVDPIPNRTQSRISSRADHMGSVKGVLYPNGSPSSRIEILVQFRPVDVRGDDLPMKVDLRVSALAQQET